MVVSYVLCCVVYDEGEVIVVVEYGIVGMVKCWVFVVFV